MSWPDPKVQSLFWAGITFLLFLLFRVALSSPPAEFEFEKRTREPPLVPSSIPIIGHVWEMWRYRGDYYKMMSEKYPSWPIFRLKVFSSTIYVVNSPELSQTLLCNPKLYSFLPLAFVFTKRVMRARKHVMDVITLNNGDNSYMNDLHRDSHASLNGPAALETNAKILAGMVRYLNNITTTGKSLKLFDWIKTTYTVVTADTLFGKVNPIAENPSLVKHLWDYDENFIGLLIDILPRFTVPKAWKAREAFTPAFVDYYNRGLDENAATFVKARRRIAREHGFNNQDLGSFDMLILHTALVNTVPNAFSMLTRIISNPVLTAEICQEVGSVATQATIDGVDHITLDVAAFDTKCPILVSTFQENIRLCVNATSVRVVQEDVVLKERYILKKGGVIQVSGGALQESSKYWGPDSTTFNPYRFVKTTEFTREQKKAQTQGLLPFGGGKHLCPGRHIAFVEIVSVLGLLVYGFEIRMKDGSLVKASQYKQQDLGQNSKSPEHDIDVVIRRKEEFKDVVFEFKLDTSLQPKEVSVL